MKELYIDDVLMDIAPDTDISLTIKSNAFSDLKQMASNSSYTIRIPKTTKNESVLMSVARVQNGGAWARTRHTARYIVDGVPIIEDGLVTLLSIGEDFEISIVWGIYPRVADIVDNDMSLRDLSSTATILFDVYNVPENYSTAMGRGYFYADYIPIQVVEYTGWLDFASVLDYTLPTITATFENGQILTGEVGETLSMAVLPTTGRRCAVLDFWLGSTAVLGNLSGLADSISWVVTDELFRVLQTGDVSLVGSATIEAPTRSAHLILNTDSSQGSCNIYPLVRNNPTASIDLNSFGGAADHARYKYAKYIHPCVSVKWLLEQIELDKGVAFKWDGAERTFIESLVLPLTTEDANAATTQQNGFEATFERTTSLGLQTAKVTKASPLVQEAQGTSSTTLHITNDCSVVIDVQLRYYHDVSGVTPVAGSYGFFYRNFLDVIVTNNGNDTTYSIGINGSGNIPSRYGNDGNLYHIIAGTGELSLAQGDTIKFDLKNNGGGLAGMEVNGGAITITENSIGKTPRGGQFPIVTNLPDIKVNDFIKYLCAVTATYPKQVNGKGEVTFATLSSMYDPSISTEWSSKTNAILLPDETTYNLNNWARKNLWKYKEDERTKGNYDGTLTIANDTLSAENNVAEFPFAASDKNVVPLYERQQKFGTYNTDATEGDNSGSLNLTGCEPRIMVGYDNSNIISLTFDGLEMQGIIDNKYNLLSGALADMTIIKVKVALSVVDIHELDETKPIYIRQFASYFALLQLDVNFGGMSTATLMRLTFSSTPEPEPPEPPTPVLPYDAEVEYLESNGTQWIDTGYLPNKNSKIRVDWSPLATTTYGYFGSRSVDSATTSLSRFTATTFSSGGAFAFAMTYNSWVTPAGRFALTLGNRYDCVAENGKYSSNGTEYTSTTLNSFSTGYPFLLFRYYSGQTANGYINSQMRLYAFQVWDGNTMLMDCIPVRVGQVGYMYDRVSEQLIGNSGTGNFVLGNDKNT